MQWGKKMIHIIRYLSGDEVQGGTMGLWRGQCVLRMLVGEWERVLEVKYLRPYESWAS